MTQPLPVAQDHGGAEHAPPPAPAARPARLPIARVRARRRLVRRVAIAGSLLGFACHLLPPEYHHVCSSLAKIASLSAGGC